MKYFSTRGSEQYLSFEETVLAGLAPNGGLYIPSHIPTLPSNWQTTWNNLSFQELSFHVLSLFISQSEIPSEDLRFLIAKSYSTFRHPEITPLKDLSSRDGNGSKKFVLELFHGPTYAFKDVALQLLGNLFEYFLNRRNKNKSADEPKERLTVVGATSGDTGSAAIYGLRNKANISIFILHPKGRVSPIQEAQMTTVTDSNVFNIAVKGTFDDCQDIVKALFSDKEFKKTYNLGAVNSINWARILAQTVYYFQSYFHFRHQLVASGVSLAEEPVLQFVVPTGNFGDILAGYYAKRMGLPIAKLVVATNENDILARFWKTGKYEKVDSTGTDTQAASGVKETHSPAMDILVSSNFERLMWYLAYESIIPVDGAQDEQKKIEKACQVVSEWMSKVKNYGRVEVPPSVLTIARKDFLAERISDGQTLETIREHYLSSPSYIADPHTAVGLAAAKVIARSNPPTTHQIILSTAHPAKFSSAVEQSLSTIPSFNFERDVLPEEFKGLLEKEKRVIDVEEPTVELVKGVIVRCVRGN